MLLHFTVKYNLLLTAPTPLEFRVWTVQEYVPRDKLPDGLKEQVSPEQAELVSSFSKTILPAEFFTRR